MYPSTYAIGVDMRKVCNTCGIEKPLKSFPKGRTRKDGTETRKAKCHKCKEAVYIESKREKQRLYAKTKKRKEAVNNSNKKYRSTKKYKQLIEARAKRKELIKRWEQRREEVRRIDYLPLFDIDKTWREVKRFFIKRDNPKCICNECGTKYHFTMYWRNTSACSEECLSKRKRDIKKRGRRKAKIKYGNHKKRAEYYGVDYEPVNRLDIFHRDNWTCVCCGVKVEITKEYASYQATIDHIIPVSKGGSHTYENIQTMCMNCNALKGDS